MRTPATLFMMAMTWVVFIWSAIEPRDWPTWGLEVAPGLLGFILILWYWKTYPLTNLLLILISLHAMILFMGAKYTYAFVPVGFWFRDNIGFERNNYDRLGHFFQGLEPAILAREILIRAKALPRGKWLNFFVITICLAFSATYEFIEWWVALLTGTGAEEFLATQGDPWDTQSDMFCAFIGAVFALVFLSRKHDRDLAKLPKSLQKDGL